MRIIGACLGVCLAALLTGQERRETSYTYDGSGRRIQAPVSVDITTATGKERAELTRSINGGTVPVERSEERVLRDDGTTRVVERVTRGFDAAGGPGLTRKVVTEESKQPDGGSTIQTTSWVADVNGNFRLTERQKAERLKTADGFQTSMVIERPSPNGGIEPVEKKTSTQRTDGARQESDTVTWRRNESGTFYQALRQVTRTEDQPGETLETSVDYEPGPAGKLEPASRTVASTRATPGGGSVRQVDVYRNAVPGRADGRTPQLIEQQLIEQSRGPGNTVVVSLSVRNPAPDGTAPKGPYRKVSEKICTGDCGK